MTDISARSARAAISTEVKPGASESGQASAPATTPQDNDAGKEAKRRAGRLPKLLAVKQAASEVEDEIAKTAQKLDELRKRKRELEQKAVNDAVESYIPVIRKMVIQHRMDEKFAAEDLESILIRELQK